MEKRKVNFSYNDILPILMNICCFATCWDSFAYCIFVPDSRLCSDSV